MSTAIHGGLALLALAFLMPGHFMPWASFQAQFVAAVGVAMVGLGAVRHAHRARRQVLWPVLALLALATASIPWLQFGGGQIHFFSDALMPSLFLVGVAVTIAAGTVWTADERTQIQVAVLTWLLAAAATSVAIALVQWLNLGWSAVWMAELPPGARPFANLGQPNHLATLLVLGLVAAVVLFELHRLGPVSMVALVTWLGIGLMMTQSRTGWLAVAILAIACVAPMLEGRPERLRLRHVTAAVVLFAVATMAWGPLNDALFIRSNVELGERLQAGPRTLIWQAMLDAVTRAPWVGYGWNQVNLAQQVVAADGVAIGRMVDSAHNAVLDLALWGGVPLAIIWVCVVVAGLAHRLAHLGSAASWGACVAILVILVHAMLEYPLAHAYFLLPVGLLWGLTSTTATTAVKAPAWVHAVAVAALSASTLKVASEYLPIEQAHRAARMAAAGIGVDRAPTVVIPDVEWLDAPRELIRFMGTPARTEMSQAELDWMQKVTQRFGSPPAMLRYALAAGLNGRGEEAALTLRRLCSMHGPLRCDEAITAWTDAQAVHPVLRSVPPPARR